MLRLCSILANWLCVLLMWKKSHTLAKDQTAGQEELWRLIYSRLRHQKRASPMELNMEIPKGNDCPITQRRCCSKFANPSMEDTNPYLRDGTKITITESLCQKLDGLKSTPSNTTNLHWKTLYIVTPKEIARNEKKWVLSLNKEGVQRPVNQRPDFAEAKQKLKRLHDDVKETSEENTPIQPTQRTRQRRDQQFEGLEEYDYQVDRQTGWRTYPSKSRGNLWHPTSSSSSTQWEQHDDWSKSWNSWRPSSWTER